MAKNFSRGEFIQALCGGDAWAISPRWADTLRGWASMEDFNPSAIVTQAGEMFGTGNTRTSIRDGVGIMQVRGPLITHENFMSWIFGFDTYESLATDFEALVNDPSVKGIVLDFYSPGGVVAGGSDLAQRIFDARSLKPNGIISRAGGDMASMAYWLGSSADKVHTSATGIVGSIGTVVQFEQDDPSSVTIVSDQSPNKRPDLSTAEGMAEIKGLLNSLSDVFISNVARNRGISSDQVIEKFGKGGVKVGADAVAVGMADAVTTFDATFSQVKNTTQERINMSQTPAAAAAPQPHPAAAAPAAETPAVDVLAQERARVSDILAAFDGTAFAGDAAGFVKDGKSVAEAQAYVLGKLKAAPAAVAPPAAAGVTQQQLAAEGSLAALAAATPSNGAAPAGASEVEANAVKAAMASGVRSFPGRRPLTTPAGR